MQVGSLVQSKGSWNDYRREYTQLSYPSDGSILTIKMVFEIAGHTFLMFEEGLFGPGYLSAERFYEIQPPLSLWELSDIFVKHT